MKSSIWPDSTPTPWLLSLIDAFAITRPPSARPAWPETSGAHLAPNFEERVQRHARMAAQDARTGLRVLRAENPGGPHHARPRNAAEGENCLRPAGQPRTRLSRMQHRQGRQVVPRLPARTEVARCSGPSLWISPERNADQARERYRRSRGDSARCTARGPRLPLSRLTAANRTRSRSTYQGSMSCAQVFSSDNRPGWLGCNNRIHTWPTRRSTAGTGSSRSCTAHSKSHFHYR